MITLDQLELAAMALREQQLVGIRFGPWHLASEKHKQTWRDGVIAVLQTLSIPIQENKDE